MSLLYAELEKNATSLFHLKTKQTNKKPHTIKDHSPVLQHLHVLLQMTEH